MVMLGIKYRNKTMKILNGYYTQIESTHDGYVVSAYFVTKNSNNVPRWNRLRNFGERLSDAIEYRDDIQYIDDCILQCLAKNYDSSIKYIRVNSSKFKKQ